MRFDGTTPVSRVLSVLMPWQRGRRPAWLIRLGLFLYDTLGKRQLLPPTRSVDLTQDVAGVPLKAKYRKAFEYSDCWVDDARLVILNLRDALAKGADINGHTAVSQARFDGTKWVVETRSDDGSQKSFTAALIVNSAGPWVDEVLKTVFGQNDARNIRLVRGSHIVVPRKFDHDRTYFFQNTDGRIIFAIPYETDYTLIGTTDMDHDDIHVQPEITHQELTYLCDMASQYFRQPVTPEDVVWTYSGVRPLYDDGASAAREATRDYVVRPDTSQGMGPLLNIFGGKLTTYRRLAEAVMTQVESLLGRKGAPWTHAAPLPGGDFSLSRVRDMIDAVQRDFPVLDAYTAQRLVRAYGTEVRNVLGVPTGLNGWGEHFGAGLYEAEVRHLIKDEWATSADDILYRRTKLGLRMTKIERSRLADFVAQLCSGDALQNQIRQANS